MIGDSGHREEQPWQLSRIRSRVTATNRGADFWGMTMFRVKDGRLVEGWNAFDFLTMYQQLGWVKSPVLP